MCGNDGSNQESRKVSLHYKLLTRPFGSQRPQFGLPNGAAACGAWGLMAAPVQQGEGRGQQGMLDMRAQDQESDWHGMQPHTLTRVRV